MSLLQIAEPNQSAKPHAHRFALGIDLGTTFCAIAHIDAYGKPQIVPNAESERITPSVILFDGANAVNGFHQHRLTLAFCGVQSLQAAVEWVDQRNDNRCHHQCNDQDDRRQQDRVAKQHG